MSKNSHKEYDEVIIMDGCKIYIRFSENPNSSAMQEIKEMLFRQGIMSDKSSEICTDSPNMR